MFTIVTQNSAHGFNPKSMKLSYVKKNDVRFCHLKVKNIKRINWGKVEKILGDTKSRIIFGNDIVPPIDSDLKTVDDTAYSHVITINALKGILEYHKNYVAKKTVILVDTFCKHQDYASVLVDYFGTVKIVTNKISLYQNFKDTKLYEDGAIVTISSSMDKITSETVLFVSPDGIVFPSMTNQHIPILSLKKLSDLVLSPVYHSFESEISDEVAHLMPDGISSHLFQAALYEYCGMRHLSKNVPAFGYLNDAKTSYEKMKISIFPIDMN